MNKLDVDVIRIICDNLNFNDILNFSIINKFCYSSIDELFYKKNFGLKHITDHGIIPNL